jgi:ATP-dependent RNA helicase DOB1
LQHYLFPTGAQGIFLVVDEKGQFRENNFAKAIQVIEDDLSISKLIEEKKQKGNKQQKQNASQEMRKLITLIVSKGLDPCIVFSFSKRECEAYSVSLKNCDFNVETERDSVEKIFKNAMETLSEED